LHGHLVRHHPGGCSLLDVLKARWWIMAAMYLAVVLTIVIAFGGQLARLFG